MLYTKFYCNTPTHQRSRSGSGSISVVGRSHFVITSPQSKSIHVRPCPHFSHLIVFTVCEHDHEYMNMSPPPPPPPPPNYRSSYAYAYGYAD